MFPDDDDPRSLMIYRNPHSVFRGGGYPYSPYGDRFLAPMARSAMEVLAEHDPEGAISLARELMRLKTRHAAVVDGIAAAREILLTRSSAFNERVSRGDPEVVQDSTGDIEIPRDGGFFSRRKECVRMRFRVRLWSG